MRYKYTLSYETKLRCLTNIKVCLLKVKQKGLICVKWLINAINLTCGTLIDGSYTM